jgi:hypothetical protein
VDVKSNPFNAPTAARSGERYTNPFGAPTAVAPIIGRCVEPLSKADDQMLACWAGKTPAFNLASVMLADDESNFYRNF